MKYDLGLLDHETDWIASAGNPFGAEVPHVPGVDPS
jgi:hypothetical protein